VKNEKPAKLKMDKTVAIRLMSLLSAMVIGEKYLDKTSTEFQMLVFSSAELADIMQDSGLMEVLQVAGDPPLVGTDCVNLGNIIAALQTAYADLCPVLMLIETDPSGPAVCDLGKYAPKVE
jgi:hypothetical protein